MFASVRGAGYRDPVAVARIDEVHLYPGLESLVHDPAIESEECITAESLHRTRIKRCWNGSIDACAFQIWRDHTQPDVRSDDWPRTTQAKDLLIMTVSYTHLR